LSKIQILDESLVALALLARAKWIGTDEECDDECKSWTLFCGPDRGDVPFATIDKELCELANPVVRRLP
jgi:hypothetical protein